MSILINKKAVKSYILAKNEQLRPGWKYTRISQEALEEINAKLKTIINRAIESHPSIGKTFKYIG